MSTNTGHELSDNHVPGDVMSWAVNTTSKDNANGLDKQKDWAWRAMNESIPLAKKLIYQYYQVNISKSYYSGCSTGGRQGLKQIQLVSDSFDGLLIGAPAWDTKHLMPWISKLASYNLPQVTLNDFNTDFFAQINGNISALCDSTATDPPDNIVSSPEACLRLFQNNPSLWNTFVTPEQLGTILGLLNTTTFPGTNATFPGYDITSTAQWGTYLDVPDSFDQEFAKYFVQNGTGPPLTWDNATILMSKVEEWNQRVGATADKFQLDSSFKPKIIMYQGLADGYIPSKSTMRYVTETQNSNADYSSWIRYFEVEGMQHCWNSGSLISDVPWYIGGVGLPSVADTYVWWMPNSTGLNNTGNDALMALTEWVENDEHRAPDRINATAFNISGTTLMVSEMSRQRPICAFPMVPLWDNGKDPNLLQSWSCGTAPAS